MKKKTLFITFGVVMLVSLIIPIFYFWLKFKSFNVSSSISDWGNFGAYIGGIITPIISMYSVIILGYITFLIGENSNMENKNLYILQKKLEAYEELMKYFPQFNSTPTRLRQAITNFAQRLSSGNDSNYNEIVVEESEKVLKQLEFYVEFHYFLFCFNPRYKHLFKYDFNSDDYIRIIDLSRQIKDNFLSVNDSLILLKMDHLKIEDNAALIEEMLDYLVNFINDIRKELEQ